METLILGGGAAGCSVAYFLMKKGHKVTLLEKKGVVGGLCRTYKYGGHPYEHGPHVLMWEDGDNIVCNTIKELTDNKLYHTCRRLYSYIEADKKAYRFPIHYDDIRGMPDCGKIYDELYKIRNPETLKLQEGRRYPILGDSAFEEYMVARIGPTLYDKMVRHYTHKMWGHPGDEQQTVVMADQHADEFKGKNIHRHDPIKFRDTPLAWGTFCVYPEEGWNVVWERMVEGAKVVQAEVLRVRDNLIQTEVLGIRDNFVVTSHDVWYNAEEYDFVINTLAPDMLLGQRGVLQATGRLIIPLLLPDLYTAMEGKETIYFPGCEPQTRITEINSITHCMEPGTLILIEIPMSQEAASTMLPHVLRWSEENNLFCSRAYPMQTSEQRGLHKYLLSQFPKNFRHCGRLAQWEYMGMAKTINNSYQLVESLCGSVA